MKINIQYFEEDDEAALVDWRGDAVGTASSWKEAHELIDALEKGNTVPHSPL